MCQADEFAPYQHAEGLQRGLGGDAGIRRRRGTMDQRRDQDELAESTSDRGLPHAEGHAYDVAKAVWGESSALGTQWAEARVQEWRSGHVEDTMRVSAQLTQK
jgi:hypothetical protein